jgi:hypothetical protein
LGAFGGTGHTRKAAETLREIARKAKRAPFGLGKALPGSQKQHLSPRRDGKQGVIATDIKPVAKLLVVKTQAQTQIK